MKLSEQLEAYTRSCELTHESPILGQWIIDDIKKLEHKAALWDKVSGLPDDFLIGTYDDRYRWCINDNHDEDIWGNTLEEALNQIEEVKAV